MKCRTFHKKVIVDTKNNSGEKLNMNNDVIYENNVIAPPPASALTPAQIRIAYNVPVNYDGTGMTIAIIDASSTSVYPQSKILSDYAALCTTFSLPNNGVNILTYPLTGGTIPTNTLGWGKKFVWIYNGHMQLHPRQISC